MKTGILGGTFDPPHIGHLIAAQDAVDQLRLDRLLFVPAAEPPHKRNRIITPAALRLEMLRAAVQDDPRFEVCELELNRPGPSYTVDTLRALRAENPDRELYLLIGADQARDLPTWRQPTEIARLARIIVLSRDGVEPLPDLRSLIAETIRVTRIDVSATDIRRRARAGKSIRYLVPAAVESIVENQQLYGPAVPNGTRMRG